MAGRGVRAARGVTDGGLSGWGGGVTEGRGGGDGCGGRQGVSRRLRAVTARRGCCGGGVTSCHPSRAPRPALSESRLRSLSRSALLAEVASAEMSLHAIYLHQVCHLRFPCSLCPQHPRDTGPLGSPGVPMSTRVSLSGCSASPPGSPAWPWSLVPRPLSPAPFQAALRSLPHWVTPTHRSWPRPDGELGMRHRSWCHPCSPFCRPFGGWGVSWTEGPLPPLRVPVWGSSAVLGGSSSNRGALTASGGCSEH